MRKTLILIMLLLPPTLSIAADKLFVLEDNCVRCHLTCERHNTSNSVISWKKSVHFRSDSGCADCHGGDKFLYMDFKKGHLGLPNAAEKNAMCGKCHIKEYKDFQFRAMEANPAQQKCEADCTICHGYHDIKKANLSIINPVNCGKCHPSERADKLITTVNQIQSALTSINAQISRKNRDKFPTETVQRQLVQIRQDLAESFHRKSSDRLISELQENIMVSLEKIKSRMEITSQGSWTSQGFKVIVFLIICMLLIIYYQRIVSRK